MSRPLDRGNQSDLGPNTSYPTSASAQFPPPQYSYNGSGYPSLEQELTMTDSYAQSTVQQNLVSQLQDAAGVTGPRNGAIRTISIDTNGSIASGMAPPLTPHQPGFSSPQHRDSIDDTPDPVIIGEGQKRKRSKVSRACDECRRKKIKCDAAAEDGSIKTCTNCSKAGLTCEYSRIPMKRGPSKGYIKELSERVQQVESLQAAMSGQSGFRNSLDAGSNAGLEPYSPDDPMSGKRNYSFNDARNPFASSEYHRDRIPSMGAWSTGSPVNQSFRARDRGSLAIAPDQPLPSLNHIESSKPFWSDGFEQPPPAKRQKTTESDEFAPINMNSTLLQNYHRVVEPQFPLLPEIDVSISILNTATPVYQHCFTNIMDLLPFASTTIDHEEEDNISPAKDESVPRFNRTKLVAFFENTMREHPDTRSDSDNLVLLWSYVLLAVYAEYNVLDTKEGISSRRNLIKQAIDLAGYIKTLPTDKKNKPSSVEPFLYVSLAERAWELSIMLAKFNSLAYGLTDFVLLSSYGITTTAASDMPDVVAFLARTSNSISTITHQVQDGTMPQSGLMIASKQLTLHSHLIENIVQTRGLERDAPIIRQVRAFFELLLSRYNVVQTPMNILSPAVELAESLSSIDGESDMLIKYNPAEMHFFTLTTITILEFLTSIPDPEMGALGLSALDQLQPVLEKRVEQLVSTRSRTEKNFWQNDDGSDVRIMAWSEILLKMIQDRRKAGWAFSAAGSSGNKSSAANGSITSAPTNTNVLVDFGLLLKVGYATVLTRYV